MDILPAIDLIGGRCVRLWKGDFDKVTTFPDSPSDIGARFAAAGADSLHVIDLDGARSGAPANLEVLTNLIDDSRHNLRIQWGGGLRDAASVTQVLEAGANRAIVGSVAVTNPSRVGDWVDQFGPDRIVVALDVRERTDGLAGSEPAYVPATQGWRQSVDQDLWELVATLAALGVRWFLSTDINRDGTKRGPNVDLYREFVDRYPDLAIQASGGIRGGDDLAELERAGLTAAVVGRTLLDGTLKAEEVFC